ncbi:MAG: Hsp70 family protein [Desulfobacterales bacterium]
MLVYDLGGGTFDITMIDIRKDSVEVICTGGDHNLGGKDWDDRIVAHMVELFQNETGTDEDILDDPDTWQDLQLSAEKAKKILSQRPKTPISVTHGGERVKMIIDRDKFEEITEDLLERTIEFTKEMLEEAKNKGYKSFDEIILVGGATRMPQIKARIEENFSVTPKIFDPDEAVAKGAAIYGWKLSLNDGLIERLSQRTNKPIAQIDEISEMIETKALSANDFKAAAQEVADKTGYTLPSVERSMLKVKNVTSKSFGIVAHTPQNEEIVFNIVLRNTGVPITLKKNFYTAVVNQKTVLIRIMESETSRVEVPPEHAVEIKTAVLNLPPNLPADLPIEITFTLNEEGRLHIMAMETSQSRQIDVVVDTASVIAGEELERAIARSQNLVIH